MIIDQDIFHAFIMLAFSEGREELCRELLRNADLFADGDVYQVEKRSGLSLVPAESGEYFPEHLFVTMPISA